MSEFTLGSLATISLVICCIDAGFWMTGGRSGKWKRRYLGAFVQTLGINALSLITGTWAWQFILVFGPEIGSRSLGYGGTTTSHKVFRRAVFALGSLAAGAILAWGVGFTGKAIILLICQAIVSIVSIVLRVKNPLPAAVEEVFVCLSLKYFNYGYLFTAVTTI